MVIEILGTETEARGIQGIKRGGPMTGIPRTGHQSVMTIALEMTGDELAPARTSRLFNCIRNNPVDLY